MAENESFVKIASHVKKLIKECAAMVSSSAELTTSIKDILKSLMTPVDESLKEKDHDKLIFYYEILSDLF